MANRIIAVSSAAGLRDALANAEAGDVIELASGDYGSLAVRDLDFSDYVTITSADGNQGARFGTVDIDNSSYVKIDGVHVENTGTGSITSALVHVTGGSNHVEVSNSEINASVDGNYDDWRGIVADEANNVRFEGNYVHDVRIGAVFIGPDNIEIVGNTFDYLRQDSMKIGANNGILIENNFGSAHMFPKADDHADFIQGQAASTDVTIRGNVALAQAAANFQGIFLADAAYTNVLIENNIIYHDQIRGISVDAGSNITVRNNSLFTVPTQDGGNNKASKIFRGPDTANFTTKNNVMSSYEEDAVVGSNGIILQYENPNGPAYYDDFYVNATAGVGVTLEDLRPRDGTPVAFGSGMGAEARLRQLLEGAPSGDASVTAADDALTVAEDGAVGFSAADLLANDTDADGGTLTITELGRPQSGTVTAHGNGSYTYAPDPNFAGSDRFTYTVTDGNGGRHLATVNVAVTAQPDAPSAVDDSVRARADTSTRIEPLANDVDADGDGIALTGFSQPAHGTLSDNGDGSLTYTPAAGYIGADSFSYSIADGTGRSDAAGVMIEVGGGPTPILQRTGLSFDGSGGQAQVLAHNASYALADGTLELAFTADGVGGRQGLFSKDSMDFDAGGHFTVLVQDGTLMVRLQTDSDTHILEAAGAIQAGQAYHAAVTFGGGGFKLYLNGALVGDSAYTGGIVANPEPIVIGANQWASSDGVADVIQDGFDGRIERVALYGQALTGGEVQALSADAGETPFNFFNMPADDQVAALYVGYFGRAPDADGRDFWVADLNAGVSQGQSPAATAQEMASEFRFSDEAQGIYPVLDPVVSPSASTAQIDTFVGNVFDNLFGRTPDAAGYDFWTGRIQERLDSDQTIGDVIVGVMAGAGGDDVSTLQNRIEVANAYTDEASTFQAGESVQLIGTVDATQASVDQALAQIG